MEGRGGDGAVWRGGDGAVWRGGDGTVGCKVCTFRDMDF